MIEEHANEDVLKILVATKCDDEDHCQVSEEMAESFATEHNISLFRTSAASGYNVNEAFESIAKLAVDK